MIANFIVQNILRNSASGGLLVLNNAHPKTTAQPKGLNVTESVVNTTPDAAAIAAVASPIERARLVTEHARRSGNLPPDLSALRRAALVEALEDGSRKVAWVAGQVGLTPSRVSALVGARKSSTVDRTTEDGSCECAS